MSKEYTYAGLSKEAKAIVDGIKKTRLSVYEYIGNIRSIYNCFSEWQYGTKRTNDIQRLVDDVPHGADEMITKSLTVFYITTNALRDAISFFVNAKHDELQKVLNGK